MSSADSQSIADAQFRERVSNVSVRGTTLDGRPFCIYYAPDGTSTTVAGTERATGTWSVRNGQVCESTSGYSYCSTFAFNPVQVSVTPVSGVGGVPFTGNHSPGNTCG